MKKKNPPTGNAKKHSFVDNTLQIDGTLQLSGDMEVTGSVQGTILADPDSDAFLGVRTGGRVSGTVHVPFMIVNGTMEGTIYCAKHLELAPGGVLKGHIYYNELIVANGAQLNGQLTYLENGKISFEDALRTSKDAASSGAPDAAVAEQEDATEAPLLAKENQAAKVISIK